MKRLILAVIVILTAIFSFGSQTNKAKRVRYTRVAVSNIFQNASADYGILLRSQNDLTKCHSFTILPQQQQIVKIANASHQKAHTNSYKTVSYEKSFYAKHTTSNAQHIADIAGLKLKDNNEYVISENKQNIIITKYNNTSINCVYANNRIASCDNIIQLQNVIKIRHTDCTSLQQQQIINKSQIKDSSSIYRKINNVQIVKNDDITNISSLQNKHISYSKLNEKESSMNKCIEYENVLEQQNIEKAILKDNSITDNQNIEKAILKDNSITDNQNIQHKYINDKSKVNLIGIKNSNIVFVQFSENFKNDIQKHFNSCISIKKYNTATEQIVNDYVNQNAIDSIKKTTTLDNAIQNIDMMLASHNNIQYISKTSNEVTFQIQYDNLVNSNEKKAYNEEYDIQTVGNIINIQKIEDNSITQQDFAKVTIIPYNITSNEKADYSIGMIIPTQQIVENVITIAKCYNENSSKNMIDAMSIASSFNKHEQKNQYDIKLIDSSTEVQIPNNSKYVAIQEMQMLAIETIKNIVKDTYANNIDVTKNEAIAQSSRSNVESYKIKQSANQTILKPLATANQSISTTVKHFNDIKTACGNYAVDAKVNIDTRMIQMTVKQQTQDMSMYFSFGTTLWEYYRELESDQFTDQQKAAICEKMLRILENNAKSAEQKYKVKIK